MVLARFLLSLLILSVLAGCSSQTTGLLNSKDVEAEGEILAGDAVVPDSGVTEPVGDGGLQAVHQLWYNGFSQPQDGAPSIYIETGKVNGPNLVTFFVMASNLGQIAGASFYLRYDAQVLRFDNGKGVVDFGSSGPYFTASAIKELAPGLVTFGAARFCKDKIPWGSTDQCGGVEIVEEVALAALTFEIVADGNGTLSFPEPNTLLLRPDRTAAEAAWISGSLVVGGQP